jgi:hypothetical protein
MLGVEAVAEGMADNVIGHHQTMPGVGKTTQTVFATRCLKDCLHAPMMTMAPYQGETIAEFSVLRREPKYQSRRVAQRLLSRERSRMKEVQCANAISFPHDVPGEFVRAAPMQTEAIRPARNSSANQPAD